MVELVRHVSEGLARKTSRRGLFGRGAEVATGALLGVAAGTLTRTKPLKAGHETVCSFPYHQPCPCDGCTSAGPCAKPCVMNTEWYASGCWVYLGVTCCDCDCKGLEGIDVCGCGTDRHNSPAYCP